MSETELNAIYRLEFYKKQHDWALQPGQRRPHSEPSAASPRAAAAPPAGRTTRGRRSRTSSTQALTESQLNMTYSVEGAGDGGGGRAPPPLPSPRFVDDLVDSWVHAASSCSAQDADADGLAPLEAEPEFARGAGAAPHSSELNLCALPAAPPPPPPPPHEHYVATASAGWAVLSDEADGGMPTIPMECDLSRPPPAPHPSPEPWPCQPMALPPAPDMPPLYGHSYEPDPCCDPELPLYAADGMYEWSEQALDAAIEAEGRAVLAHVQRGRDLFVLRHRAASDVAPPCPLCGAATPPPPRGRGHLPRPLSIGQWARGQAACMLTRYP